VQRLSLGIVIAVLALAACEMARDPVSPSKLKPSAPNFDIDCTADPYACNDIQNGINFLLQSKNATCQAIGSSLQAMYNAPPGQGFKPGSTAQGGDNDMYVLMQPAVSTPSGYQAQDGYIYVTSNWTAGPSAAISASAGGLLAHEYEHSIGYDGPAHNTGQSNYWQDVCQEG